MLSIQTINQDEEREREREWVRVERQIRLEPKGFVLPYSPAVIGNFLNRNK